MIAFPERVVFGNHAEMGTEFFPARLLCKCICIAFGIRVKVECNLSADKCSVT